MMNDELRIGCLSSFNPPSIHHSAFIIHHFKIMIVTCPNCTTRLQLDKAKVPARPFSVRCPKCQQIINAQPPVAQSQRDALAAVGNLPASSRSQQGAGLAPAAPPSEGHDAAEPQP